MSVSAVIGLDILVVDTYRFYIVVICVFASYMNKNKIKIGLVSNNERINEVIQ